MIIILVFLQDRDNRGGPRLLFYIFPFSKRADISSCLEKERGAIPNRASPNLAPAPMQSSNPSVAHAPFNSMHIQKRLNKLKMITENPRIL